MSKVQNEENGTFLVGDRVTAFGNEGVVKKLTGNGLFVEVSFPDFPHSSVLFNVDGRVSSWHKEPSLRKL